MSFILSQPQQIGVTWQYTIEWHQPRDVASDVDAPKRDVVSRKNIVTVTSKPRSQMESSLITVSTWTSETTLNRTVAVGIDDANSTSNAEEFQPLTIFAQVLKGGNPIVGARVMMHVEIELGNGSMIALTPVQLFDDGYGGEILTFSIRPSTAFYFKIPGHKLMKSDININHEKGIDLVCLGFELETKGWKIYTNSLSYGGLTVCLYPNCFCLFATCPCISIRLTTCL